MGLPKETGLELAAQTLAGTAQLYLETRQHPAVLRDRVTTPAGCTSAGLVVMEEAGVAAAIARTIRVATERAAEMGEMTTQKQLFK